MTVRALVVALFLFFALMAWVATAHAGVLFFSGFDTGQLTEWAGEQATPQVNSSTVDGCSPRTGNYYMHVGVNAGFIENAALTPSFNVTELFVRTAFQIDAAPSAIAPFLVANNVANTNNLFSFRVGTDQKISWVFNSLTGAAVATGTTVLSTGVWYLFQAHMLEAGSSTGGVEWKLYNAAGALLETVTSFGTTTNALGNIGQVHVGSVTFTNSGTTHFCYDDVMFRDDQYPGDGGSIARQGTSGSPTYTAWDKSSCTGSLIENCWASTPWNATQHATSATAGDAQTMLVHSFSTTQACCGSTVITPGSPITACKVESVAFAASGTPPLTLRHRLAGVDTDTSVTLVTTPNADGVNDGRNDCCWTDTLTNLNAAEIGVVHGTGVISVQANDLWMICDYLFVTTPPRHRVNQQ